MSRFVHAEAVMGTIVTFEVRGADPAVAGPSILRAAAWLQWVDETFSTYRADSQVCRLERGVLTEDECDPEVRHVLALGEGLRAATLGFFDVRASGRLDPSGVVKGWAVERVSEMLSDDGCPDHLVDCGGDVRLHGEAGPGQEWHVGVTHPWRLDAYCAALHLGEGAVATSGTYRRGFHVVDPHRGQAVTELAAVTVVGPELTMTDAYATAALAMGAGAREWLEGLFEHEALVIDADGRGWQTSGFGRYRLDVVTA